MRKTNKAPTFPLVLLALVSLGACTSEDGITNESGDLSREKAAELIQSSRDFPQHATITLGKSYATGRYQRVDESKPGICITYGGPDWKADLPLLTTLQDRQLITLSEERRTTAHNCHRWWVDIGLTPQGREYLVGESDQEYTFRTADIVVGEVTGLLFGQGNNTAIAEYNFRAVDVTPFAVAPVSVPEASEERFVLYDDGWRLAK